MKFYTLMLNLDILREELSIFVTFQEHNSSPLELIRAFISMDNITINELSRLAALYLIG